MEIVDFFRFPVISASEDELFKTYDVGLKSYLEGAVHPNVAHSLVALFDSGIVYNEVQRKIISNTVTSKKKSFVYMPCIDGNIGEVQIDLAINMGCVAVVFHPYLQKIDKDKIEIVQQLAQYAAEKGIFTCVCSAYGSKDIFKYQPLEIVVAIAEVVNLPVVIVHGGGAKVIDAFLIAEAFPNIYLDTSFSLHYWIGSSVEEDYAFAIKNLGVDRWMFGSDSPFRPLDEAIDIHIEFCSRHGFSQKEICQLMHGTAAKLLKL